MIEIKYVVYKFISPSGKAYIGLTSDLKRREIRHQYSKQCIAFHTAIKKYGFENFEKMILKEDLSISEANYWEEFFIREHKTFHPNGYNLKAGGKHTSLCEESRKKISVSNKGKCFSEESRMKISNSRKGKPLTEECKQKISAIRTGKKHSEETKLKISIAHKGKLLTDELKKRLSDSHKGKKHSEETKLKMSLAHKGKIKTEDHLRNLSKSLKGKTFSLERRAVLSASAKKRTPETNLKIAIAIKEGWRKKILSQQTITN